MKINDPLKMVTAKIIGNFAIREILAKINATLDI